MTVPEAPLETVENGLAPSGEGWFVLNLADATWISHDLFGHTCVFESPAARFLQLGVNVRVLMPGQPNAKYHSESVQEGFLVLSGECTLIVEGEERPLKAWDFFHCPAGTDHVVVGAGEGPSVVLMVGVRGEGKSLHYPVDEVAARYGASVEQETSEPSEAYAGVAPRRFARPELPGVPWR
jgi:uncharacterized cupin superfamily protein